MSRPHVLVVDDERITRRALTSQLGEQGYEVSAVESLASATLALDAHTFSAVLLDIRLIDGDGLNLLERLQRERPALRVIIASAFADSERVIRAMSLGAFEYLTKPFDYDRLLSTVARAVAVPEAVSAAAAGGHDEPSGRLIGTSPCMLEVWKSIGRAAASDSPVLITGETGVGKELVALAIHEHSSRRARPFVAVNLAAMPASLIESELFGHEKGAFTGANAARDGRFTRAAEGTLFLDEIADFDPSLQTKLLRVLESGGFERVGGNVELRSRARVIAATSRPAEPGSPGATMRQDLFYRLGVLRIEVPPLRERREDIPALVQAFLRDAPPPRRAISQAALRRLMEHGWAGNVRELRHVLQRAAVMSRAEILDVADFALPEPKQAGEPAATTDELDLRSALERLERSLIVKALARSHGNRTEAARLLGIRRALLYDRMRHFGLDGPRDES